MCILQIVIFIRQINTKIIIINLYFHDVDLISRFALERRVIGNRGLVTVIKIASGCGQIIYFGAAHQFI